MAAASLIQVSSLTFRDDPKFRFLQGEVKRSDRGVPLEKSIFMMYRRMTKNEFVDMRLVLRGGAPRAKKEVDLPPLNM